MPAAGQLGLEDRRAIVDLTVRYCWALDGGEFDDLAGVFSEDATVDFGFTRADGLAAIRQVVSGALAPLDASQHMVTNHEVSADAEGESAHCRCYFQAQHTKKGLEGGANFVIAGIYRDVVANTSAGWRIRHRELEVLWTEGNPAVVGRGPAKS